MIRSYTLLFLLCLLALGSCTLPKEYQRMSNRFYPSSKLALSAIDSTADVFVETRDHQIIEGHEMMNGNNSGTLLLDDEPFKLRRLFAYQDDIGYHRFYKRTFGRLLPMTRIYVGNLNLYSQEVIVVQTTTNGYSSYTSARKVIVSCYEDPSDRKLHEMHEARRLAGLVKDNPRALAEVERYRKNNVKNKLAYYGGYAGALAGVTFCLFPPLVPVGIPLVVGGMGTIAAAYRPAIKNDVHLYKALLINNGMSVRAKKAPVPETEAQAEK